MTCVENVIAGLAFRRSRCGARAARSAPRAPARARGARRQGRCCRRRSSPISTRSGWSSPARSRSIPTLLLLDEWLAGLNPTELRDGIALVRSLRAKGLTIILVEHVMDAIRSLCDRCIVMNAGRKIAEGRPPPCSPTAR